MVILKKKIKITPVKQIGNSTYFEVKTPIEIIKWNNNSIFVVDHGYIDEVGNIIFIGITIENKRFYYSSINATGNLKTNEITIDDIDNAVNTKEEIMKIILKHINDLIDDKDKIDIEKYLKNNWTDLYKSYIEKFWC